MISSRKRLGITSGLMALAAGVGLALTVEGCSGGSSGGGGPAVLGIRPQPGDPWQEANEGLEGGEVTALAISSVDPNRAYLAGLYGGLFGSVDGGGAWAWRQEGNFYALAVDPADSQVLYVAGETYQAGSFQERGVFRSRDGGASLELRSNGLPSDTVDSLHATNVPGVLWALPFVSGGRVVYRTSDAGTTWTSAGSGLPTGVNAITSLSAHPSDSAQAFVTSPSSGLFRTLDGGQSWATVDTGLTSFMPDFVHVDPANGDRVYVLSGTELARTLDGGATWSSQALPTGVVVAMSASPAQPGLVYLRCSAAQPGDWNGIYRSVDGGATWTATGMGGLLDEERVWRDVIAHPTRADVVVATSVPRGVLWSLDRGETFAPSNTDLVSYAHLQVLLAPSSATRVYAVAEQLDFSFARSDDGGLTWTRSPVALELPGTSCGAVHPLDPDVVYVGRYGGDVVSVTLDGGASWAAAASGIIGAVQVLRIDPADPQRLFAAGSEDVSRSANGGSTWTGSSAGISGATFNAIDLELSADGQTLFVASNLVGGAYLLRSIDGGATWTALDSSLPGGSLDLPTDIAVHPTDGAQALVALNGHGILRTLDRGASWSTLSGFSDPNPSRLAFDPTDPSVIYVAGTDGISKSSDDGATWRLATRGLTNVVVRGLAIPPLAPRTVFATVSGPVGVFRTTTGGE